MGLSGIADAPRVRIMMRDRKLRAPLRHNNEGSQLFSHELWASQIMNTNWLIVGYIVARAAYKRVVGGWGDIVVSHGESHECVVVSHKGSGSKEGDRQHFTITISRSFVLLWASLCRICKSFEHSLPKLPCKWLFFVNDSYVLLIE